MPRPSRIDPTKIATMKDALARGVSVREIAREIGVDEKTVRNWAKKVQGKPARERAAVPAADDAAAASAALAAPLPTPGDPEALEIVRARHQLIQGLLERLEGAVEAEEYPATSFVTLAKYGDDLARLIAELTPPAPKNPDEDPDVLDAERTLLARVEKLLTEAEGRQVG